MTASLKSVKLIDKPPHRTEIHFAAAEGNVELVLALIEAGAPVDEEDYDRRTPA
jgi:hypothetical protein